MIKLGITGGIGSGKSYVSSILNKRGIPLYDTDSQAKRLTVSDCSIRNGLTALLGCQVYMPDGNLNKPVLASYLFANEENARKVNSIIHPRVYEDFLRWAADMERNNHPLTAMESAILFESGFDKIVDRIVMVYAPEPLRIQRVMTRDGITEAQVRTRMRAQMDEKEKCKRADFVIVNDGVSPLGEQIDRVLLSLVGRKDIV